MNIIPKSKFIDFNPQAGNLIRDIAEAVLDRLGENGQCIVMSTFASKADSPYLPYYTRSQKQAMLNKLLKVVYNDIAELKGEISLRGFIEQATGEMLDNYEDKAANKNISQSSAIQAHFLDTYKLKAENGKISACCGEELIDLTNLIPPSNVLNNLGKALLVYQTELRGEFEHKLNEIEKNIEVAELRKMMIGGKGNQKKLKDQIDEDVHDIEKLSEYLKDRFQLLRLEPGLKIETESSSSSSEESFSNQETFMKEKSEINELKAKIQKYEDSSPKYKNPLEKEFKWLEARKKINDYGRNSLSEEEWQVLAEDQKRKLLNDASHIGSVYDVWTQLNARVRIPRVKRGSLDSTEKHELRDEILGNKVAEVEQIAKEFKINTTYLKIDKLQLEANYPCLIVRNDSLSVALKTQNIQREEQLIDATIEEIEEIEEKISSKTIIQKM